MRNILALFIIVIVFNNYHPEKKDNTRTQDIYGIIESLSVHVSLEKMKFHALPVPPPVKNANVDSLIQTRKQDDIEKLIQQTIKRNGKLIVAIDSVLNPLKVPSNKKEYLKDCLSLSFKETFKNTDTPTSIDISQIQLNNYLFLIKMSSKITLEKGLKNLMSY